MVTRSKNRAHVLEEHSEDTIITLRNAPNEVEGELRGFTMDSSTVSCHPMVTRSRNRTSVVGENSVHKTISLRNSSGDVETVARIWKYRQHLLTHVRLLALRQISYEVESAASEKTKSEIEKWEPEAGTRMECESEEDKEACADSSAPSSHSDEHVNGLLLGENSEFTELQQENLRIIAGGVADIESYNGLSHNVSEATPFSSSFSSRYCQEFLELRDDLERIVFLRRLIEQLKAGMELVREDFMSINSIKTTW
ncbi:hypothetical protein Aduo_000631 [Ancylostoma duodenale]